MKRIKQIQTADAVRFFQKSMMEKYKLVTYTNKNEPAVFMGCYHARDLNKILQHRGLSIVLWLGTDALRYLQRPNVADSLRGENIRHIAQSEYIARDLDKVGLKYKRINIATSNYKANPVPLGDTVYMYYGGNQEHFQNFYNYPLFKEIQEELSSIKFLAACRGRFKPIEMPAVYENCFMGLRLTPHDGLAETVVEMGMMGRRCVWNEPFPGCYQWENKEDVKNAILKEHKNIGKTNTQLIKEVERYIETGTDWLKEKYWI